MDSASRRQMRSIFEQLPYELSWWTKSSTSWFGVWRHTTPSLIYVFGHYIPFVFLFRFAHFLVYIDIKHLS